MCGSMLKLACIKIHYMNKYIFPQSVAEYNIRSNKIKKYKNKLLIKINK